MNEEKIKTLIFDLGGVYFTDGTKNAIKMISAKYDISEAEIAEVLNGDLGSQYRLGTITVDEFWNAGKEKWGKMGILNEELSGIWLNEYKPIQGTVELIGQLKKAGYEIIFLSDNVQERVDYLDAKYHFIKNFKDGVFSHLVGVRKPDPAIYQHALDKTTSAAENCVFIDDKEKMLEPAKLLGIKTIHFQSPEQLKLELEKLGI